MSLGQLLLKRPQEPVQFEAFVFVPPKLEADLFSKVDAQDPVPSPVGTVEKSLIDHTTPF
jgi:hypothetical protein